MKLIPAILRRKRQAPEPTIAPSHSETSTRDHLMRGWHNTSSGELCPGFPVGPGNVLADIGCGSGDHAYFCAAMGAQVILADMDPAALAQASALLARLQPAPRFETRLTDGATLPIADATADRVICTEVIEHVDDPALLMQELVRIGRPDALYLLSCPDPQAEAIFKRIAHPMHFERPNHIRILGREEFATIVVDAGLVIEHRLSRGFYNMLWWVLFWGCPSLGADMRHPLLDSWANTWSLLLDQPNGPTIKNALDDLLPHSQVIIARKP